MDQPEQPHSDPEGYISRRSLARRWDTSVATIRRREEKKLLTPCRLLGGQVVCYPLAEVMAAEGKAGG
jgi:hypothetical protein